MHLGHAEHDVCGDVLVGHGARRVTGDVDAVFAREYAADLLVGRVLLVGPPGVAVEGEHGLCRIGDAEAGLDAMLDAIRDGRAAGEDRREILKRLASEHEVDRLLDRITNAKPPGRCRLHVCALHALAADAANDLLAAIDAEHAPATSLVGSFSTAMIVHAGPGVLGLAWWWEPLEA